MLKAQKAEELPRFLQVILQSYAIYFRKRYHTTGYVFQGRYKSIPIEKESYLLECTRYIERNPLRARIVSSPEEYEWTTYLYLELGQTDAERQDNYRSYILEGRPYDSIVDKELRMG